MFEAKPFAFQECLIKVPFEFPIDDNWSHSTNRDK
jgi:hypothetical protein